MVSDPLDDWKTQAEAAEILKCSQKTVGRMAAQKKIQRVLRRVPGRKPMPVFNPDDIEAIRAEMVQVEPFPVKERGEGKALVRQTSPWARLICWLNCSRIGYQRREWSRWSRRFF